MLVHEKYPEGQPDKDKFPKKYTEYSDYKSETLLACRFYNCDVYNYIDIDLKDNKHIEPSELEKIVIEVAEILGAVCVERSISGGYHIIVQTNTIEGEKTKWSWSESVFNEFKKVGINIDENAIGSKRLLYWTGDIIWENDPTNIKTIERVINDKKTHVSTKKTTTNNQTNISATEVFIINGEEATDEQLSRLKNRLENDILPRFNKSLSHNKQFPFLGAVQAMGYDDTTIVWNKVREAVDQTNTPSRHNDCYDLTTLYNWLFPPEKVNDDDVKIAPYDYVIHTDDKFLSTETYRQIVDMPEKVIIQKSVGYGGTRKILENPFGCKQIVVIPYISVKNDKEMEMEKLMADGKIENGIIINAIEKYDMIEAVKSNNNEPCTIICCPEKLKKYGVIDAINDNGWTVIWDETHVVHTTEGYRNLSDVSSKLKSAMVHTLTATPIPDIIINDERYGYSGMKTVRIDNGWRANMNIINVGEMKILKSTRYMIDNWMVDEKVIIHLYVECLKDAYSILGDLDPSKIRVYCSGNKDRDNKEKINGWGWTMQEDNELWDVEGCIYVITEYGQQGKNGAFNDGVSGKRYMGLSIVQNPWSTVQSIGRVRDTNRDMQGGYTDFNWIIKSTAKVEFYHYSNNSFAHYLGKDKHLKVKNYYEYVKYLILNNVNNIRNDYFNMIGINAVEKALDDNIKSVDLIDIVEHIQLTVNKSPYNTIEKIDIVIHGDEKTYKKMIRTVSNEMDKIMWELCRSKKEDFSAYISDCIKDGKKLTIECIMSFYCKYNKGFECIIRYISNWIKAKKTVDSKQMLDCMHCDIKLIINSCYHQ